MWLRVMVLAVAISAATEQASAEIKNRTIAGWLVSSEKDPFGDDHRVVAMKKGSGAHIAFRCFSKKPHLAVIEGTAFRRGGFTPGETFDAKIRVDEKPIVDGFAIAVTTDLLQVELFDDTVFKDAANGRELALKFEKSGNHSLLRLDLKGASKALPEFWAACAIKP